MHLAVEVGTVADGSLAGAIQYSVDLEVKRLVVPFAALPGFQETGALDLAGARAARAQIEDAGRSFSTMVYWAPPPMVACEPEGEAPFAALCRNLEVMNEVGADMLSMFVMVARPLDASQEEAAWARLVEFYRALMPRAEEAGVKVALHTVAMPSRNLLWNHAAVERLFADVPSAHNGLTLCVGNYWNADGERMYDIMRGLGDKLFYVHLRSTKAAWGETPYWFDSGGPDFKRVFEILREVGFQGDLRSEHMPEVTGENRTDIGTAWAIGYTKGLLEGLGD
jgi:D-mannonate dehydratase